MIEVYQEYALYVHWPLYKGVCSVLRSAKPAPILASDHCQVELRIITYKLKMYWRHRCN